MAKRPLLAELHAHTTWSDGVLTPSELVDLYGRAGFDVLAITDHVVRSEIAVHVRAETYRDYLDAVDVEAERARRQYGLLVLPGLELTVGNADPRRAGHALAVGLRKFVSVDAGLEGALHEARAAGAALIAAHPGAASGSARGTAWFAENPERAAEVVDRFELFNREEGFDWVAHRNLPFIATGDFHLPEHLFSWKTLLSCEPAEDAIVERLRSNAPCALMRIAAGRVAA